MSDDLEGLIEQLLGHGDLCEEARSLIELAQQTQQTGAGLRPCPNPACCGTGTEEIHNGPQVRRCGICLGRGVVPAK